MNKTIQTCKSDENTKIKTRGSMDDKVSSERFYIELWGSCLNCKEHKKVKYK